MYFATSFLALILSIAPTDAAVLSPRDLWEEKCSADHNPEVTPTDFSSQDAWRISMLNCLENLDTYQWNGAECQPVSRGNATSLGPAFGFWKGEKNFSGPANAKRCYELCLPCLTRGIMAGKAVTTSCYHKSYGVSNGVTPRWTCTMGFDWKGYPDSGTAVS